MSTKCSFPPSDLKHFQVLEHDTAAAQLKRWAEGQDNPPSEIKADDENAKKLTLQMPAGSTLFLHYWGGGSDPIRPQEYHIMIPTKELFAVGEKYAKCVDDFEEKYQVDPIYGNLLNGPPGKVTGRDMWEYRIAEYTFGHCY